MAYLDGATPTRLGPRPRKRERGPSLSKINLRKGKKESGVVTEAPLSIPINVFKQISQPSWLNTLSVIFSHVSQAQVQMYLDM